MITANKQCSKCSKSIFKKDSQSNISWAKCNTCDSCKKLKQAECSRRYYLKNRNDILNKDISKYQKYYRDSEHGKLVRRISQAKRRAKITSSLKEYIKYLFTYENFCCYCTKSENLQIEHLLPLSRGGEHTEDNVKLACKTCNLRKGNKTVEEYLKYLKEI